MLIDFKSETYTGLRFAANSEGMSVAAFVSRMCDQYVAANVEISYQMVENPVDIEELARMFHGVGGKVSVSFGGEEK